MKVPFHLRPRPEREPATALLLPSHRVEDLLRLWAHLGCDPVPPTFGVADGFLVRLPQPTREPIPGVLRLRALAADLLVPADADLLPTLLGEEAADLVRQRGLVFLPGDRVLEYTPDRPLPLAGLVERAGLRRPSWQALPKVRSLPERLTEISLDLPPSSVDEVLEEGGGDIGTEEPRPAESGPPAWMAGRAAFGVGKALARLGKALGLRGLARAGARLMAGALALAPRLSESLLGRHEASLRALLREFREGDIERALRRALPLNLDPARGAGPDPRSRLPDHDVHYSLGDLLGNDSGPGSIWFGEQGTYRELEREYRNQAELATRRGDYRRAAFIYGRLLRDYRAAAAALSQGGLHRDAALVYEKRLADPLASAREYEAAGEIDRALQLYQQRGEHALAGDLLRRAGEEDRAVAQYQIAAAVLAERAQGSWQAGELLFVRAGRADLALPYYAAGWASRPQGGFAPCAVRLAQLHVQAEATDRLLALLAEAEVFYRQAGNDALAAEFFNHVARLADAPVLAARRDALRDRALRALAAKMRQRIERDAGAGPLVSTLLGPDTVWAPAVVSDAQAAATWAVKRRREPTPARSATTTLGRRASVVRAVCRAPSTGTIFVGFESGEVVGFDPGTGAATSITEARAPVHSLATSDDGSTLIILSQLRSTEARLSGFVRMPDCWMVSSQEVKTAEAAWLSPVLARDLNRSGHEVAGLWDGENLRFLMASSLLTLERWDLTDQCLHPKAALLLPSFAVKTPDLAALVFGGHQVGYHPLTAPTALAERKVLGWNPSLPEGCTLSHPVVSWLRRGPDGLELAGLGSGGQLCWSRLEFEDGTLEEVTTNTWEAGQAYRAVAVVRSGLIAAVTRTGVDWVRPGRGVLRAVGATEVALPGAVACFPHYRGSELIVISGDGTVTRVAQERY